MQLKGGAESNQEKFREALSHEGVKQCSTNNEGTLLSCGGTYLITSKVSPDCDINNKPVSCRSLGNV